MFSTLVEGARAKSPTQTRDEKKDFCALLNLQIITEKLLYNLDIPAEIHKKFQMLKTETYAAIGIDISNPFMSVNALFGREKDRQVKDDMLFHSITMKKFVEYLHDLTMAIGLKLESPRMDQQEQTELPVFKAMQLGNWADQNQQINELQLDFEAKSKALVHSI